MPMPITPATIIAAILFGIVSSYIAQKRGRSPYRWFFIGFLFGIFGLVASFMAPKRKVGPIASVVKSDPPPLIIQGPIDKFWYYLDPARERQGPMSHQALTSAFRQGKITLSTYVWNEEMSDWKFLQEIVK